ncbi:hypothetical protein GTPT_2629 [Tatumella ptyseos ATCC 33301]|uniref:Uncharacterized protein n=1 Tax=Tatumella ptyseos ATCC 33301 TaxID=1005995 RepID=A0A085JD93_9GAMM|nr:hypothetical protein GTPT_2629 [Tatumella ptyseos ATCC 33301]
MMMEVFFTGITVPGLSERTGRRRQIGGNFAHRQRLNKKLTKNGGILIRSMTKNKLD